MHCIKSVEVLLSSIDSVTKKGFIVTSDLTSYPVISELLPVFLSGGEGNKEYISGEKSMESYKWLFNLIVLNLYLLCIETLAKTEITIANCDKISDLKSKELDLFSRLDPSIRHRLQKRGLSLKENIYIGFDTEFTKKDLEHNTLISSQLALTTKLYVQIPRIKSYKISFIDDKTNKVIEQKQSSSNFNYLKIESSIQMCISSIRQIKYEKHDLSMLLLIESLKVIKGLSYYEHEDQILFSLPRSMIQPYINYSSSFSIKELIQISSGLAKSPLERSTKVLMNLLKNVCSTSITIPEGKENLGVQLQERYKDDKSVEELITREDQQLPLLPNSVEILGDLDERRLSRKFMTDLFPQRVSMTKTRNYYIIAHLTQADLSLMSDFKEIKEDLSIVNGSFVTLGKAIKFHGRNVHIRDTMLLAPGGSRSLASIGVLYGENLHKLSMNQEDLQDMQGFLERDKVKFTEYALRDALISLIHAS